VCPGAGAGWAHRVCRLVADRPEDDFYRETFTPELCCPSYETLNGYKGILEDNGFVDIEAYAAGIILQDATDVRVETVLWVKDVI